MKIINFAKPDHVQLPTPDLLAQLPETIAAPAQEVADLRRRYVAAKQDLIDAEHRRDGVKVADTEAAGIALRAGKPAPKPALPAAEKAVLAKAADLEIIGSAALAAGEDLRAAIEENRAAVEGELAETRAQQKVACHEAARDLAAAVATGGETAALASWVKEPTRAPNLLAHGGNRETEIASVNGEKLTVGRLVAELTNAWAPVEPAPTNPAQALKARP